MGYRTRSHLKAVLRTGRRSEITIESGAVVSNWDAETLLDY